MKVVKEPETMRDVPAEECVFCTSQTRYWHKATNMPVCKHCAITHTVAEVKIKRQAILNKNTKEFISKLKP